MPWWTRVSASRPATSADYREGGVAIDTGKQLVRPQPFAIFRRQSLPRWLTWGNLRRLPLLQLFVIGLFIFISIFGQWLAPVPFDQQNLRLRFLPPAWLEGGNLHYLLGTDNLGRDILSRIIVGAQTSFIVAVAALAFGSVMGSLIGLASGYFGGRFDAFLMRTADGMMSFPLILAALLLVAVIGPGVHTVVIATSLILWARFARLIRSEVLSVRERDFVKLARIAGASNLRIMLVHILPNVLNSVVVLLTLQLG